MPASFADPLDAIATSTAHDLDAVHPFVLSVTGSVGERAHDEGLGVAVWTVNAPSDLDAMVRLGVDAIITDDVGLGLRAVAGAQGPGG